MRNLNFCSAFGAASFRMAAPEIAEIVFLKTASAFLRSQLAIPDSERDDELDKVIFKDVDLADRLFTDNAGTRLTAEFEKLQNKPVRRKTFHEYVDAGADFIEYAKNEIDANVHSASSPGKVSSQIENGTDSLIERKTIAETAAIIFQATESSRADVDFMKEREDELLDESERLEAARKALAAEDEGIVKLAWRTMTRKTTLFRKRLRNLKCIQKNQFDLITNSAKKKLRSLECNILENKFGEIEFVRIQGTNLNEGIKGEIDRFGEHYEIMRQAARESNVFLLPINVFEFLDRHFPDGKIDDLATEAATAFSNDLRWKTISSTDGLREAIALSVRDKILEELEHMDPVHILSDNLTPTDFQIRVEEAARISSPAAGHTLSPQEAHLISYIVGPSSAERMLNIVKGLYLNKNWTFIEKPGDTIEFIQKSVGLRGTHVHHRRWENAYNKLIKKSAVDIISLEPNDILTPNNTVFIRKNRDRCAFYLILAALMGAIYTEDTGLYYKSLKKRFSLTDDFNAAVEILEKDFHLQVDIFSRFFNIEMKDSGKRAAIFERLNKMRNGADVFFSNFNVGMLEGFETMIEFLEQRRLTSYPNGNMALSGE